MATPLNLEDSLVAFVQDKTSEYLLKSSLRDEEGKSVYSPPFVTTGFIPSYLTGEEDKQIIPSIVVQFSTADYTPERSSFAVEFLISTLDDELDHQGYRDGLNIAERLKTALWEEKLFGPWRLTVPFNYRVLHVEQQATRAIEHPIYRVVMLATFETGAVAPRQTALIR